MQSMTQANTPATVLPKKRAAAYCRVSTKSDLQDGSFEVQIEYYRNYIAKHADYVLVDIYGDHGRSGRTMKHRPELRRLLNDCRNGKIDLILTKSVSRFARNLSECIGAIRELKRYDVSIYFEKEKLNTGDENNELLLGILATIAQEESISISQNMQWARTRHYEIGQPWERPSYAYRSIGKEHHWEVVASEAEFVRLAFYLAGRGVKYPAIREALNEMERKRGSGRVWHQKPIVNLLTNLAYIGDYLTNKECTIIDEDGMKRCRNHGYTDQFYIESHHEPLISKDLYYGVGELIKRHLLFQKKARYSEEEQRLLEHCQNLAKRERLRYAYDWCIKEDNL